MAANLGKVGSKVAQSFHLFVGNIKWTVSQSKLWYGLKHGCVVGIDSCYYVM